MKLVSVSSSILQSCVANKKICYGCYAVIKKPPVAPFGAFGGTPRSFSGSRCSDVGWGYLVEVVRTAIANLPPCSFIPDYKSEGAAVFQPNKRNTLNSMIITGSLSETAFL
jgi:hypothetical protein